MQSLIFLQNQADFYKEGPSERKKGLPNHVDVNISVCRKSDKQEHYKSCLIG